MGQDVEEHFLGHLDRVFVDDVRDHKRLLHKVDERTVARVNAAYKAFVVAPDLLVGVLGVVAEALGVRSPRALLAAVPAPLLVEEDVRVVGLGRDAHALVEPRLHAAKALVRNPVCAERLHGAVVELKPLTFLGTLLDERVVVPRICCSPVRNNAHQFIHIIIVFVVIIVVVVVVLRRFSLFCCSYCLVLLFALVFVHVHIITVVIIVIFLVEALFCVWVEGESEREMELVVNLEVGERLVAELKAAEVENEHRRRLEEAGALEGVALFAAAGLAGALVVALEELAADPVSEGLLEAALALDVDLDGGGLGDVLADMRAAAWDHLVAHLCGEDVCDGFEAGALDGVLEVPHEVTQEFDGVHLDIRLKVRAQRLCEHLCLLCHALALLHVEEQPLQRPQERHVRLLRVQLICVDLKQRPPELRRHEELLQCAVHVACRPLVVEARVPARSTHSAVRKERPPREIVHVHVFCSLLDRRSQRTRRKALGQPRPEQRQQEVVRQLPRPLLLALGDVLLGLRCGRRKEAVFEHLPEQLLPHAFAFFLFLLLLLPAADVGREGRCEAKQALEDAVCAILAAPKVLLCDRPGSDEHRHLLEQPVHIDLAVVRCC